MRWVWHMRSMQSEIRTALAIRQWESIRYSACCRQGVAESSLENLPLAKGYAVLQQINAGMDRCCECLQG